MDCPVIGPASGKALEYQHLMQGPDKALWERAFANYRGGNIAAQNIFVGVGSDEAIDLLMRIFCEPGKDAIMITPPTYGMYKVCANVNNVDIVKVPLTPDFELQIPEVSKSNCLDIRGHTF